MMDALTCEAVEAGLPRRLPARTPTVLLIEVDGLTDGLEETLRHIERLCLENGASGVRLSKSAEESAALWYARKSAFGAMGRLAPNYYLQDGVVPRTKLPITLGRVEAISKEYKLPIANVFHAGDGNLHPIILFDRRNPGEIERALEAAVQTLPGVHRRRRLGLRRARHRAGEEEATAARLHDRRPVRDGEPEEVVQSLSPVQPRQDLPDLARLPGDPAD